MKNINEGQLVSVALAAGAEKLAGCRQAAARKLSELGIAASELPPFDVPAGFDFTSAPDFRERGVLEWIESLEAPVKGDPSGVVALKTHFARLLARFVATCNRRFA